MGRSQCSRFDKPAAHYGRKCEFLYTGAGTLATASQLVATNKARGSGQHCCAECHFSHEQRESTRRWRSITFREITGTALLLPRDRTLQWKETMARWFESRHYKHFWVHTGTS